MTEPSRLVAALLAFAGFKVRTIRSTETPASRSKGILRFNDPKSDFEILVVSILTMTLGADLHGQCHHGFILCSHPSTMGDEHIKGQLSRLGQKDIPQWYTLKTVDTFQDRQESNSLLKKVHLLAVTSGAIPEWIPWLLQEIVCYEIFKTDQNLPFNRYAWIIYLEHHSKSRDRHTERIRKIGHMCSLLVRMLLVANDEEEGVFLQEKPELTIEALYELSGEWTLERIEHLLTLDSQLVMEEVLPSLREERSNVEQSREMREERLQRRLDAAVRRAQEVAAEEDDPEEMPDEDDGIEDVDEEGDIPGSAQGTEEAGNPSLLAGNTSLQGEASLFVSNN